MASYSELISQIADLQKMAERQRKEEYSSVLKTIKRQIAEYGISAQELGFSSAVSAGRGRPAAAKGSGKVKAGAKKRRSNSGVKVAPKYRDHNGNTWTGRGKMPKWVSEAVAGGISLDSLRITG